MGLGSWKIVGEDRLTGATEAVGGQKGLGLRLANSPVKWDGRLIGVVDWCPVISMDHQSRLAPVAEVLRDGME